MKILMIELRLLGSLIVMAVWFIFYLVQRIRIQRQSGQNIFRKRKKRNKKKQENSFWITAWQPERNKSKNLIS